MATARICCAPSRVGITPRGPPAKDQEGVLGRPEQTSEPPRSERAAHTDPSDEQLMLAYRAGDARAFRTLTVRHSDRLYGFILRQVRLPETARDLVQDTFARVVKNAASFRPDARFTTWIFTIARNLCVDAQRRQKHRNTVALDAPVRRDEAQGATLIEFIGDDQQGQDHRVHDQRFSKALNGALNALPPEQRDVFLMRELDGLKFREIAEIVGVPENTVKSRMRYALDALRQHLGAYDPDR
jgi:RNA polymerase sigma-70 factor (ECF subfamily)